MPVAYPNDFDLEQLGPYLLLFFIVVATILSVAQKISLNLIRKAFDRSKTTIAGHEVDHWVKSLEVPPEISFDQTQNNIVNLCGHYYFFVAFTSYVICFGRYGYGSSFSTTNHWCLIAVGEHEVSILERHQKVFARLSKDDPKLGAYVVKSLPKFARLLKDSSGCRKTNCEPGDAPNPHSPSAQGAGGR